MKINVKGGTPESGVSLCVTCSWGLARRGYSSAEEEVFCRAIRPSERVSYKVRECSEYEDRRLPNLYSMEKIAWILLTKSAGRTIGFVSGDRFRELEGAEAEVVPATAYDRKSESRS